ncbi:MAG: SDR family NAD(P)-dependent oxidoreductase [Polyangiales bacterium]
MVVVITGASTGIGRACALAWNGRGAKLVLNARSAEKLADLAWGSADAIAVPGDVTQPSVRDAIVEHALAKYGRIDVLVNNAGVGLYGKYTSITPELLREVFELNVVAPMALTQRAMPALEKSRGTVVMMSSIAGVVAMPRTGGYAATKYALEAMSQSLRAECEAKGNGVRVCVVRPGLTETPFADNARLAEGRSTRAGLRGSLPIMSAEAVADATVRAVERGEAEVDLTASARAISALARVNRPALRLVLARLARRMGM